MFGEECSLTAWCVVCLWRNTPQSISFSRLLLRLTTPHHPNTGGSILQAGFIEEDLGDNTSFILRLGYNAVKKDWVWLGEGENKEV